MWGRARDIGPYPIQHVVVASGADGPWWVCGHVNLVTRNKGQEVCPPPVGVEWEGAVMGPHPDGLISGRGVQGPQRVFDPCDLRPVAHIEGLQEGGTGDTQTRLSSGQPPIATGGLGVGRRLRKGGWQGQRPWQTRTSWKQPSRLAKTCSRPWLSPAQSWGSW